MDATKEYARRLAKIEKRYQRDGDLPRAIERVAWSSGIPIWWLEQFAPTWARTAECFELSRHDFLAKQEIRKSVPRDRTCGSSKSFRISIPRSFIREEQEFKYD